MKTLLNTIVLIIIALVSLLWSISNLSKYNLLNKMDTNTKKIVSVIVIISIILMIINCVTIMKKEEEQKTTSINYGALPSDRSNIIYQLPNGRYIIINRANFNNFEKFIGGQTLSSFIRSAGNNRTYRKLDDAKKAIKNIREANNTEKDYITRFLDVITLKSWNPPPTPKPDQQSDVPEQKRIRSYWRFYQRNDGFYEYQEPNSPGLGCCIRSRTDLDDFIKQRNIGNNYRIINDTWSINNTQLLSTIGDTTIRRHYNDNKVYIWYGANVSWKDGAFNNLDEAMKKLNEMSM